MIRRINGGGRRFGNRCFRFPVSTINPDFFNSSTGNEDEGNFFWEEISFKILIDCYFILFFIFFFFFLFEHPTHVTNTIRFGSFINLLLASENSRAFVNEGPRVRVWKIEASFS